MERPDPERRIYDDAFVRLVTAAVVYKSNLPRTLHSHILAEASSRPGVEIYLGDESARGAEPVLLEVLHQAYLISISPQSIRVTTAKYHRWERLRAVLSDWLKLVSSGREARSASLWYLNEVRPPNDVAADSWGDYVNLPVARDVGLGDISGMFGGIVLCPFDSLGAEPGQHSDHRHVTVEWAHTEQGALSEGHPLASRYSPSDETVLAIELAASELLNEPSDIERTLDELEVQHSAIKDVFEKILTPKARQLMSGGADAISR